MTFVTGRMKCLLLSLLSEVNWFVGFTYFTAFSHKRADERRTVNEPDSREHMIWLIASDADSVQRFSIFSYFFLYILGRAVDTWLNSQLSSAR